MIGVGTGELIEESDHWTMSTADRQPSAHFEHTIAITSDGPVRLTGPPSFEELNSMPDWLKDRDLWVNW
jgi:methionyl aminopeptidase